MDNVHVLRCGVQLDRRTRLLEVGVHCQKGKRVESSRSENTALAANPHRQSERFWVPCGSSSFMAQCTEEIICWLITRRLKLYYSVVLHGGRLWSDILQTTDHKHSISTTINCHVHIHLNREGEDVAAACEEVAVFYAGLKNCRHNKLNRIHA